MLLTAIVNFLLIAAAVYFCIVLPMNKMIERRNRRLGIEPTEEPADPNTMLLTEIRDALTGHNAGALRTDGMQPGLSGQPGTTGGTIR